jgi:hypothetical protein
MIFNKITSAILPYQYSASLRNAWYTNAIEHQCNPLIACRGIEKKFKMKILQNIDNLVDYVVTDWNALVRSKHAHPDIKRRE